MSKPIVDPFRIKRRSEPEPESTATSDLVDNPFAQFEDKADPKIPTATLQIYDFIREYLSRKQDTHVNRASSATMCVKRRWYQRNGREAETLTPRKIVNFLLGDLSEKALLFFISQGCVGPGRLYSKVDFGRVVGTNTFQGKDINLYEQERLTAQIPGLSEPITAHADGFGKRNSDGKWELIEIKSAANYGFMGFQESGPADYLKQAHALMMTDKAKALGIKEVRFFYLRKETGHLYDRIFSFDPEIAQEVVDGFIVSNQVEEPKAPFLIVNETFRNKPTGRKIAQFPCTHCPFLKTCHGPYQIDWKADQFGFLKPVYVFSEGKI